MWCMHLKQALLGSCWVLLLVGGLVLSFLLGRYLGMDREIMPFLVVPPYYLLVRRLGLRPLLLGTGLLFVLGWGAYAILSWLTIVDGLW